MEHTSANSKRKTPDFVGQIIFASRWLQLPIYLGLIVVQGICLQIYEIIMGSTYGLRRNGQQYDYVGSIESD